MAVPVLVSGPAETSVTLVELKQYLRVEHTDHDALLGRLLTAATEELDGPQGSLGRVLVSQTWRVDYETFWDADYRLPLKPIISITSVQYYVPDEVAYTTIGAENYRFMTDDLGSFIEPVSGYTWPTLDDRVDAVRVTFVAGYGAAAAVPVRLKAAVCERVKQLYDPLSEGEFRTSVQNYERLALGHRRFFV